MLTTTACACANLVRMFQRGGGTSSITAPASPDYMIKAGSRRRLARPTRGAQLARPPRARTIRNLTKYRRHCHVLPGGTAVPPHRHHLRRLWRRGGDRAADPLRHHPAHHRRGRMDGFSSAASSSGCGRSTPSWPTSTARGRSCKAGSIPGRPGAAATPAYRPEMAGHRAARTASTPILPASTWCAPAPTNSTCSRTMPHAVGRLLHAGESRGDAAALPGVVRAATRSRRSIATPSSCCETLQSVAPARAAAEPTVVLLTPGHYNSRLLRA